MLLDRNGTVKKKNEKIKKRYLGSLVTRRIGIKGAGTAHTHFTVETIECCERKFRVFAFVCEFPRWRHYRLLSERSVSAPLMASYPYLVDKSSRKRVKDKVYSRDVAAQNS